MTSCTIASGSGFPSGVCRHGSDGRAINKNTTAAANNNPAQIYRGFRIAIFYRICR
jgi:hypothetical protein